jgi:hypothetical protein
MIEYTSKGRWGGKLTRKPLPENDPSLDALAPAAREALTRIWIRRAAMERRVADSFEVIHGSLVRRKASPELITLAERAIDDEFRHAELSRIVASRIAGEELPAPERLVLDVPKHAGARPELRDTLFILGQCVLNETTAGAYLECCLVRAKGSLAKAALAELLSDEIDHGRIGWAHLATLDAATRREVAGWLLPMAYLNLRTWRYETPPDPTHTEQLTAHGAPAPEVIHEALVNALRQIILPGLKQVGVPTELLERWLDSGASTERPPVELVSAGDLPPRKRAGARLTEAEARDA